MNYHLRLVILSIMIKQIVSFSLISSFTRITILHRHKNSLTSHFFDSFRSYSKSSVHAKNLHHSRKSSSSETKLYSSHSSNISDSTKNRHFGIIGGGLAGLSVASHLLQKSISLSSSSIS